LVLAAFYLSAIQTWHLGYGWHDQQRIYQLLLLCAFAPLPALLPQSALPRLAQFLLIGLLLLGLCSSLLAAWPQWALKEWSRYAGLILLAIAVSGLAGRTAWQNFIFWAMAAIGFVHAYHRGMTDRFPYDGTR